MPATKGTRKSKLEKPDKQDKRVGATRRDDERMDEDGAGTVEAGDDHESYCVDCGKVVLASHQGLCCDSCGFWHHAGCEKLSDEVYNFLHKHNEEKSILWFCKKCLVINKKYKATTASFQEHQQLLEDKFSELSGSMNKKIEELADTFTKKLEKQNQQNNLGVQVNMLDKKLEDLATALNKKIEKETEHKSAGVEDQRRVEEKFEVLIDTVKQRLEVNSNLGEVVCSKLKEDKEEEQEIRRRRTNIIIHGMPESLNEDGDQRYKEEENQLIDLLHDINCDSISVSNLIRLGKKQDNPAENPRTLMVVVASEEQQEKILRRAKNLRDKKSLGRDKIFIHPDLTPKQRQRRQQLVKEKRRREETGEKNLLIINDRIVVRKLKEIKTNP